MPRQPNSGVSQRHLLDHGVNGKGDRDRTVDRDRFRENMDEVQMPNDVDMKPIGGGRLRKVYA